MPTVYGDCAFLCLPWDSRLKVYSIQIECADYWR